MNDIGLFDLIRYYDPAVVSVCTMEALADYQRNRDLDALKTESGEPVLSAAKPMIFRCRLLTRTQRRMVKSVQGDELRHDLAARLGIMSIRNMPKAGALTDVIAHRSNAGGPIEDAELDALGLSETDLEEIGSVVYAKSFLPLGTPLHCPRLASSEHAWLAVRLSHLAAQSKAPETRPAEA